MAGTTQATKKELQFFTAKENYAAREHTAETDHPFRTKFERDRDRVLYSKEFRRLSGKTQVFVAGFDDNVRTRLTHTIEVSQIAQTIAKHLSLDETLTEAIALGHDVGHTPFGHAGERALNLIMNGCEPIYDFNNPNSLEKSQRGFKHNFQGVRAVTHLERINSNFLGLNLTDYTVWGILHHSKCAYKPCDYLSDKGNCTHLRRNKECHCGGTFNLSFYDDHHTFLSNSSWTLEALVVALADEIAQRNHDIEDGLYSGLLTKRELIQELNNFQKYFTDEEKEKLEKISTAESPRKELELAAISSFIVNFFVTSCIKQSKKNLKNLIEKYSITSSSDFNLKKPEIWKKEKKKLVDLISYPPELEVKEKDLQNYLYRAIIFSHMAQRFDGKSTYIIRCLFKAYLTNPQQLPNQTVYRVFQLYKQAKGEECDAEQPNSPNFMGQIRTLVEKWHHKHSSIDYRTALLRAICDYVAGMTDQFALDQFEALYGGEDCRKW